MPIYDYIHRKSQYDLMKNANNIKPKITKDAGFVHESFRNETNGVIWNFFFHKTNPQNKSFKNESMKRIHKTNLSKKVYETDPRNESFENCFTKRIHETNLLKIDWIRKSGSTGFVWIRKSIVLRIREDS
jgi:hypothetical protein